MRIHDCIAGDEAAFLMEIHAALKEGAGQYQCTVPQGVRIIVAAHEVNHFFPEVDTIDINEEEGVLLLTTVGCSTRH